METLPIKPFNKNFRRATVCPPGSKSVTNRALILAALRNGTSHLSGALFSEDTLTMISCLKKLGFIVDFDEKNKTISVVGCGGEIPCSDATLYVANAGTAARFITAMLALKRGGTFSLDGSAEMRKRPMQGLVSALEKLGCSFEFSGTQGHFPFVMKTSGAVGDSISVDASASSQILSAILQIAPCIPDSRSGRFTVHLCGETVSKPFISMTTRMIAQFGGAVEAQGNTFFCGGGYGAETFDYAIEPDATAASYFLILPFVHRGCVVEIADFNADGLQGDSAFAATLSTPPHDLLSASERSSSLFASAGTCRGNIDVDFNAISDTFLTLAAVSPLMDKGKTMAIRGIEHTRKQETDRISAMATELAKIVGEENVKQAEDSILVCSCGLDIVRERANAQPDKMFHIATYKDHRVAMSFGVLGTFDLRGDGSPWLAVEDPHCCSKTFPEFFDVLQRIRE